MSFTTSHKAVVVVGLAAAVGLACGPLQRPVTQRAVTPALGVSLHKEEAIMLGALPLALAHDAGAENRQEIDEVIVGGMSLDPLLTLFVVPVMVKRFAHRQVPGEITIPADPGPALPGRLA
jgi:hypothetical protein